MGDLCADLHMEGVLNTSILNTNLKANDICYLDLFLEDFIKFVLIVKILKQISLFFIDFDHDIYFSRRTAPG